MKKQILIISIFLLACATIVTAQKTRLGDKKTKLITEKSVADVTGKMSVKDDASNVLMEVNDEGDKGSISLPAFGAGLGPATTTDKLYNVNGSLYWSGSALGTAGSAGGWTDGGTNVYLSTSGDKVGIGTTSPEFKLTLDNDGGIIAKGTYDSGATLSTSGAGTRLIWYPKKAAFRAGYVNGTQWDDGNIGYSSVAMGSGTTASGDRSTAMGVSTTASGCYSTAMGYGTTASGWNSTAMGYNATAGAYASLAIGRYNVGGGTAYSWKAGDPVFEIGIGANGSNKANAMTVLKNGNVGIGTTSPEFKLTLDSDGGILARGTYGSGADLTTSGTGTRLIWYPKKAAFRAGYAYGDYWDDGNIGDCSVAMGTGTKASGIYSTAMGFHTMASGTISAAMGYYTTASGSYSTAIGYSTTASGWNSTAMGYNATAGAYASLAIGRYNVGGGSATSWVSGDPVFEIGIGADGSNKANAMTVLKNGNVGISTATPSEKLEVDGKIKTSQLQVTTSPTAGYVLTADASGNATWQAAASGSGDFSNGGEAGGADRTLGNIDDFDLGFLTNNTNRLHIQNDGKVGIGTTSPEFKLSLDSDGGIIAKGTYGSGVTLSTSGAGTRLIWYPKKAAFRAGYVSGTQWDDGNIGSCSVAMGRSTKASGYSSTAMGYSTTASGNSSTAMGYSTTASGYSSTAMGYYTTASGWNSTAMGRSSTAGAYASVAIGRYNVGGGTADSWMAGDPVFEIGIGADGSNRANAMTVLKNGNVGIGTATPSEKLEVYGKVKTLDLQVGTSTTAGYVLTADASGNATWQAVASGSGDFSNGGEAGGADRTLGNTDNYDLGFLTNNTNRLHIQNDGKVGIGTTSPATLLDVRGAGTDEGGSAGYGEVTAYFKNTSTAHSAISVDAVDGKDAALYLAQNGEAMWDIRNDDSIGDKFQIRYQGGTSANQEVLTIETDGDVGIGTTSPESKLYVDGRFELPNNDASGTAGSGSIEIGNSLRIDNNEIITNTGTILNLQADNNGDLKVDNGTLFVDASANRVGISNTSPGYLLTMEASGGGYYSATDHQWHNGSTRKIKRDIVPNEMDVLDILEQVQVVNYRYKTEVNEDAGAPYHIGFIAEDTPELLSGKNRDSMALGDCVGLLLAVVKEQQKKISELQEKIQKLEK